MSGLFHAPHEPQRRAPAPVSRPHRRQQRFHPDADRHAKLLSQFAVEGSLAGAYSHGGKRLTERLLVLGYFFGEQRQQCFVPIVVPVRITFALGYQPPVMLDISVVDETRHGDLHGYVGEGGARGPPELDYLPFQTQCNTRRRVAN